MKTMKKFKLSFFITAIVLLTFSSCSYRLVDFTAISSKNTNLKIDKSQGIRVSGSSNGFLGLGASIKDALDKALQSAGPDYDLLIDGVIRVNDFYLVSGYKVEGTAISTSKMRASLGVKGFEEWCKANNVISNESLKLKN